jgi:hypothetical protein
MLSALESSLSGLEAADNGEAGPEE